MENANMKFTGLAAMACACLFLVPASAQTKPPESTSKVKKVLLYNKIGGWVHEGGCADVKSVMAKLAAAKGFELTQLADDGGITLDFLREFQVIIWNNNNNGALCIPPSGPESFIWRCRTAAIPSDGVPCCPESTRGRIWRGFP